MQRIEVEVSAGFAMRLEEGREQVADRMLAEIMRHEADTQRFAGLVPAGEQAGRARRRHIADGAEDAHQVAILDGVIGRQKRQAAQRIHVVVQPAWAVVGRQAAVDVRDNEAARALAMVQPGRAPRNRGIGGEPDVEGLRRAVLDGRAGDMQRLVEAVQHLQADRKRVQRLDALAVALHELMDERRAFRGAAGVDQQVHIVPQRAEIGGVAGKRVAIDLFGIRGPTGLAQEIGEADGGAHGGGGAAQGFPQHRLGLGSTALEFQHDAEIVKHGIVIRAGAQDIAERLARLVIGTLPEVQRAKEFPDIGTRRFQPRGDIEVLDGVVEFRQIGGVARLFDEGVGGVGRFHGCGTAKNKGIEQAQCP